MVEFLGRGRRPDAYGARRLSGLELVEDRGEIERFGRELGEYLEGRRRRLDWPLDLRLARSDFHREVLRRTAAIPYGAVASYSGIAHDVGRPRAVRAAAQALRWNPIPLVIPCHRVIGSSGLLTGYAGGTTEKKQRLLEVEGVPMTRTRGDFRIQRDHMYVAGAGRPGVLPADVRLGRPLSSGRAPVRVAGPVRGDRPRALHVLPARPPPARLAVVHFGRPGASSQPSAVRRSFIPPSARFHAGARSGSYEVREEART